jgi:hypothetical protein
MTWRNLLLVAACLIPLSPYAADIYRWVDESGRTQFGDTVPEKYKASARKLANPPEPTAQQRSEGADRAAKDKSAAARSGDKAAPGKAALDKAAGAQPGKAAPVQARASPEECATQQRLYRESQECFAPYRQANGSVKAEAFKSCTVVADPSPSCGIQSR